MPEVPGSFGRHCLQSPSTLAYVQAFYYSDKQDLQANYILTANTIPFTCWKSYMLVAKQPPKVFQSNWVARTEGWGGGRKLLILPVPMFCMDQLTQICSFILKRISLLFVYWLKTLDSHEHKKTRLFKKVFWEEWWIYLDGSQSYLHVPEGRWYWTSICPALGPSSTTWCIYLS